MRNKAAQVGKAILEIWMATLHDTGSGIGSQIQKEKVTEA